MQTRKRTAVRRKRRAATGDILPTLPRKPRIDSKWREHYERLLALRESLLQRQGDLNKDALEEQPIFSSHMADAGTDNYDRDFALGMLSSEQDALYEVEGAINRIQNRSYGICELTGKRVEAERLRAIPWTRFSAAAEKQLELSGEVKRARLGPREPVARLAPTDEAEEA